MVWTCGRKASALKPSFHAVTHGGDLLLFLQLERLWQSQLLVSANLQPNERTPRAICFPSYAHHAHLISLHSRHVCPPRWLNLSSSCPGGSSRGSGCVPSKADIILGSGEDSSNLDADGCGDNCIMEAHAALGQEVLNMGVACEMSEVP